MSVLLLAVIYLVFISLGLPDSLIGSSWPVISAELQVDEGMQGAVTIIVSAGTIISSFATGWLNRKLKPYGTVVVSILLTVTGLLGFFFSKEFYHLCLAAVPLGLGAGAIDATLNNYVANNYKAIQLNFLHAFWGLGAAVSPLIISEFLTEGNKVKVSIRFRGRELAHPELGKEVLDRILAILTENGVQYNLDKGAFMEGKMMSMFVSPVKGQKK